VKPSGLAGLLRRRLPILEWGAEYSGQTLVGDLVAAAIVSMMLIPQSLAYALLAGLPPQVGLYAAMAPLLLYAVFGTSRALAVGPEAVGCLMTGAAAAQVAAQGTPEHLGAVVALALLTGLLMIAWGCALASGELPAIRWSGFITAAAVQIAAGQLGPLSASTRRARACWRSSSRCCLTWAKRSPSRRPSASRRWSSCCGRSEA
jgi:SulP family sulfate permease